MRHQRLLCNGITSIIPCAFTDGSLHQAFVKSIFEATCGIMSMRCWGVFLAEHLRRMRASRGLTLRQLARAARVNVSTLSRWEAGMTTPRVYELRAVLTALRATETECAQAWQLLDAPRATPMAVGVREGAPSPSGAAPIGGELLRALRGRRGWTLEQVALHVGVTVSTLSRWERSESWPSDEQLGRLCTVLGASEAEHQALQNGRGVLTWLPFEVASAAEMEELLEAVNTDQLPIDPVMTDLLYRCVQGRLWQMVSVNRAPKSLLIDAFAYHCRYLVEQARVHEAQLSVQRALRLMPRSEPLRPHWFYIVHAQAKGAAECSPHLIPMEGVVILRRWLSQAEQCAPEHAAWFWRNSAEYLSFSRHRHEAVETHTVARRKSDPWREGDPNILLSDALVLANLGQSEQALRLLTDNPSLADPEEQGVQQCINKALIWIRVLCQCGLHAEAQRWWLRLQQIHGMLAPRGMPWWYNWAKGELQAFSAPAAEGEQHR